MTKQKLPDLFSIMAPAASTKKSPASPKPNKKNKPVDITTVMGGTTPAGVMGKPSPATAQHDNTPRHHARNDSPETVATISTRLKKTIEQHFDHVRVLGEISSFKRAPSGHGYFNLKDSDEKETALLNCFLLSHRFSYLPFVPAEGMMVIATGKISTYTARSNYQLFIDRLELAGTGNLLQILEQRKQKLLAEGLFDNARKKPLPHFPKIIGVITSPTGAVIRDIIHRVRARFPCHIIIYPVLVQGEGAANDICQAIAAMNNLTPHHDQFPKPDVLIIARGGGSLEDLWTFNEEAVVRAVAASGIPTISAIGHETDTTLIDFAADARAPTPTAAAEMALPFLLADMLRHTQQLQDNANMLMQRAMDKRQETLRHWRARILSPANIIAQKNNHLQNIHQHLLHWQKYFFKQQEEKLSSSMRLLESLSYKKTLQRGYSIVRQDQQIVARQKNLNPDKNMAIEFADGAIEVTMAKKTS